MADNPHSIVVIDDDPDVRALVEMLLEVDERFDVLACVGAGREGVDLVRQLQPDAVVVDLELPDIDGMAVIAEIRAMLPEARIVVFSAFADPFTLLDALRSGADGYLDKGSAWAELVPTLAELCDEQLSSR
ncbi:MAG: two-component system, NarL family, response regulator NreC [Actinomycetota bacterium]|jgi:DNA-binding NarL/FixJ family response regulator|nr:two-component system, NarL family, response regulator NreC [Actinomycetota bacterium]